MDAPESDDEDIKHSDDSIQDDSSDDHEEDSEKMDVDETEWKEEEEPRVYEEAPVKVTRNPADPTPEERERHDATHLPYRPWCPICVEAQATEDPHYKLTAEEREQGLPQLCADYCEIGDDVLDETDKQNCVVARDKWSKAVHATIV